MSRALFFLIACVLATPASAAKHLAGPWRLPDVPAIVAGEIVAIEDRGERELFTNEARPDHWLYPYSVAKIRIVETLKNATGQRLAAGDTVVVWFPTSNAARNLSEPGKVIWSESMEVREVSAGQSAAYLVGRLYDEWHFQGEALDVSVVKNALAEIARPDSSGSAPDKETTER